MSSSNNPPTQKNNPSQAPSQQGSARSTTGNNNQVAVGSGSNASGSASASSTHAASAPPVSACPYHGPILQLAARANRVERLTTMERFMAEGPHEQPSMLVRDDNGKLSTSKDCTCGPASLEL
ncbi:MAG: hypothetical protein M1820_006379 [Bogoriella megaspora]|nr:MAG: hypothetical protein M1820_006379 [Bogoriella megaspora]